MIILHRPEVVSFVLSTKPQAGRITPYLPVHKESYGPRTLATPSYRLLPSSNGSSSRKRAWQPTQDNGARLRMSGKHHLCVPALKFLSALLLQYSDGDSSHLWCV